MSSLAAIPLVAAAAVAGRGALQVLADGAAFANLLANGTTEEPTPVASADESSLADREKSWQAALENFRQLLIQKLAAAGMNLSEPIEIQDDGLGGLRVAGNHADRAVIEQTLTGDSGLSEQLKSLAADYAALHPEFDPRQVAFGVLLSGGELRVSLGSE